jgi:hypothetical protein
MRLSAPRPPARVLLVSLALLAAWPVSASAQSYLLARSVTFMGGAAAYELGARSTTPVVALRGDAELTKWLVGDLGLSVLRPNEERGLRRGYAVPEAQLQLQLRAGALRPYVGAGGGWFYAVGANRKGQSAFAASAAAGTRLDFEDVRFGLRAEARVRGMDRDFDRRMTEFTGGIAWRF